jgi:heat shock protein HslJ
VRGLGRLVVLGPLVLVVAGCLTTSEVLVDRPWKLVEVAGAPPADPDGIAGVGFGADGRFQVNTGCTSGGGTYHLDGNRILLDSEQLVATPCPSALAAQQTAMLSVIEGEPVYAIDTGTGHLRLTTDAGDVLLFEAP